MGFEDRREQGIGFDETFAFAEKSQRALVAGQRASFVMPERGHDVGQRAHAALLSQQMGQRKAGIGMRGIEVDGLAQGRLGLDWPRTHAQGVAEQVMQRCRLGDALHGGFENVAREGRLQPQQGFAGHRPIGLARGSIAQAIDQRLCTRGRQHAAQAIEGCRYRSGTHVGQIRPLSWRWVRGGLGRRSKSERSMLNLILQQTLLGTSPNTTLGFAFAHPNPPLLRFPRHSSCP